MLKLLSVLLVFLKELIFDSKEEYNLQSVHFDIRKVLVYVILVCSLFLNYALFQRSIVLAREVRQLRPAAAQGKNPGAASSDSSGSAASTK